MTEVSFPKPSEWLDLEICRILYDHFDEVAYLYKASSQDPLPPFYTRYPGRLESILESVKLRSDMEQLNALETGLLYYIKITRGHPFFNGNKRMAAHIFSVYLMLHQLVITVGAEKRVSLALHIERSDLSDDEIFQFLKDPFYKLVIHDV